LNPPLRTRHPASHVTLLASSLAVLAAPSLARQATDPPAWPESWSTTAVPVAAAPDGAEEMDAAGVAEIPAVSAPTGDAKPGAPCPELEGQTPALDWFRHGVERSVCVTAWRFDSLFGVLPEDQIVERRATHGRLRLGVKWDERDGFEEEVALRAQVHLPIAERRMRVVFGRDTDEAFIEGGSREFDGVTFTRQVGMYHGALASFAVGPNIDNASTHMLWVVHLDVKHAAPELADRQEAVPNGRQAWINPQVLESRADAEYPPGGGPIAPGGRACQPEVAGQTELGMPITQDVLHINVRFALTHLDHVALGRGIDLHAVLVGAVAFARHRPGNHRPRIGVHEDASAFLGAWRMGAHPAQGTVVAVIPWRAQQGALASVRVGEDGIRRLPSTRGCGKALNHGS